MNGITFLAAAAPHVFAQAAEPATGESPGADPAPGAPPGAFVSLLFPILLIIAFYFLLIAPQRKRQKEHAKMLEAITPGDEILTQGGIYGTVTAVKGDRLAVRIAEGTRVEVSKAYIAAVEKKAAS